MWFHSLQSYRCDIGDLDFDRATVSESWTSMKEKSISSMPSVRHAPANAKFHGVISSLSTMKKSKMCSYFDGEITDGKSSIWLFGFDTGVCKKPALYEESKTAVVIINCEVKNPLRGNNLEV